MSETEKKKPVSRSKEAFKLRMREQARNSKDSPFPWKTVGIGAAAAAVICIGGYIWQAGRYETAYFPHTAINGMDVGGKTADEVKEMIASGAAAYELKLSMREDESAVILGSEISLKAEFDGSLEEILRQQDPYAWPLYLARGPEYDIKALISFDEDQLDQALSGLPQLDPAIAKAPSDAALSEFQQGEGYSILPETEGTLLNAARTKEAVCGAVHELKTELDLDQAGCYEEPKVRADDEALAKRLEEINRFAAMSVTYTFGSRSEVLDGGTISRWVSYDENGQPVFDDEQIAAFVKKLGSKYNTAYTKRKFKTSYGPEVEVAGVYGWRIDGAAEAAQLKADILNGESVTREPVYMQTAASRDGNDYGTTYAEVNLTAQHLFFYKDGKKILESDFVSGNQSKGYTTPPGLFSLTYKQRDAVLKGEGYASPVKFWMPFNGGIGFHDASWRNTFGGTIYKKNGSHGCVNMPYEAAKTLYENVYKGMPVICYNLEGTESKETSKASGKAEAQTQPAAQTPVQTAPSVPAQTQPQTPAETQSQAPTAAQTPEETKVPETGQGNGAGETSAAGDKISENGGPGMASSQASQEASQGGPGVSKETAPSQTALQPQTSESAPADSGQTAGVVIQPVS